MGRSLFNIALADRATGPAGEDKRFLDVKLSDLTKEQIEKYYKDKSKSGRKDQKSGGFYLRVLLPVCKNSAFEVPGIRDCVWAGSELLCGKN